MTTHPWWEKQADDLSLRLYRQGFSPVSLVDALERSHRLSSKIGLITRKMLLLKRRAINSTTPLTILNDFLDEKARLLSMTNMIRVESLDDRQEIRFFKSKEGYIKIDVLPDDFCSVLFPDWG